MHTTTVVIGAGRLGRTVAARLTGARLYGRGQQPDLDDCRRLLIATPDAEIERVCQALAPRLDPEASVIHFSSATSVHALEAGPPQLTDAPLPSRVQARNVATMGNPNGAWISNPRSHDCVRDVVARARCASLTQRLELLKDPCFKGFPIWVC